MIVFPIDILSFFCDRKSCQCWCGVYLRHQLLHCSLLDHGELWHRIMITRVRILIEGQLTLDIVKEKL